MCRVKSFPSTRPRLQTREIFGIGISASRKSSAVPRNHLTAPQKKFPLAEPRLQTRAIFVIFTFSVTENHWVCPGIFVLRRRKRFESIGYRLQTHAFFELASLRHGNHWMFPGITLLRRIKNFHRQDPGYRPKQFFNLHICVAEIIGCAPESPGCAARKKV